MNYKILYIWLNNIKGIGPVLANELIEYFGEIDKVYSANYDDLLKVDGIGPKSAKSIFENKDLDKSNEIYNKCKILDIKVITKECNEYPNILKSFKKAPLILYVRGNLKQFDNGVCIVGARRCSEYGKSITIELAKEVSKVQIPIISGLAKGIDSYAHTVLLHNDNYTIAVVGTGVDKCYPSEHKALLDKIIENGAVISQFELGTSNRPSNFIKRNELMAMLSKKIVVVEASKDSGSLYTANYGLEYKKQVFAVPGSIYSKCSEGTNKLLNEGVSAYLSTTDIVDKTSIDNKEIKSCENERGIEKVIIDLIGKGTLSIDVIRSKISSTYNIDEILFEMEAENKIKQIAGGYINNPRGF